MPPPHPRTYPPEPHTHTNSLSLSLYVSHASVPTEKIVGLRRLRFERLTSAAAAQQPPSPSSSDDALDADAFDSDSSPSERTLLQQSPRHNATLDAGQMPVVVPEVVWENQRLLPRSGSAAADASSSFWSPVVFEHMGRIAAFYSSNRGILGHAVREVVPVRLLNKPHLWVTPDWEVDPTLPGSDADGWIYAAGFSEFDRVTGELSEAALHSGSEAASSERVVRRRRVIRKRKIDGSDLSWFQELLDCRYVDHSARYTTVQ